MFLYIVTLKNTCQFQEKKKSNIMKAQIHASTNYHTNIIKDIIIIIKKNFQSNVFLRFSEYFTLYVVCSHMYYAFIKTSAPYIITEC